MFKRNVNYGFVGVRHGHQTDAPPSYHDHRHGQRPSSEPGLPTVFAPETPSNTDANTKPSYLAVMSAMCASGYGYEDIFLELQAMGFNVSKADCRRFVIPQTHGAHRKGQATGGR